jgi:hypothetical protein
MLIEEDCFHDDYQALYLLLKTRNISQKRIDMTIGEIHGGLANTALLYLFIVSAIAFWRFFRKQGIDANLWGMLAIAELLIIAQVGLGIYLWIIGARPGRTIHLLYGLLIPALIPGTYLYTKGRNGRAEVLVYATATIIMVGLVVRATFTGEISL